MKMEVFMEYLPVGKPNIWKTLCDTQYLLVR